MPSFCCVLNCGMRGNRDKVRFFRIPAVLKNAGESTNTLSKQRQEMWIGAIKRGPFKETQLKYSRVCSRHFISGAPAELSDKDNPDWVPNQLMGYISTEQAAEADRSSQRFKRRKCLKEEEQNEPVAGPSTSGISEDIQEIIHEAPEEICASITRSLSTQTDLTIEDLRKITDDHMYSSTRIYSLEEKLKKLEFNEDSLKNDDQKTCYFTGLVNSAMLFTFFDGIKNYLPIHHNNVLSPFQQLLLTLMRLHLNLPLKFLAYQFGVSPSTSSRIFYETIDVLYDRYKCFVFWPTREELQKNVPMCFSECFGNKVAVIIDCFEVNTETPSKHVRTAQCCSNYKHHETVKFVIGITPQGSISFISKAYRGRASDKFIVENSGILDLILPNDIILADRRCLIEESVEILGDNLQISAFTKGESQWHAMDIESTHNIDRVRIHVKRIIGLLKKKYKIFQGTLPMSSLKNLSDNQSILDKMIVICSALLNMNPSVISLN